MKFELTMDNIKEIYKAGIRRGNEESSAYEWGCQPSGRLYDELESELQDILNGYGKVRWGDPEYVDYVMVKEMVDV